jgi:hypothetical protein
MILGLRLRLGLSLSLSLSPSLDISPSLSPACPPCIQLQQIAGWGKKPCRP